MRKLILLLSLIFVLGACSQPTGNSSDDPETADSAEAVLDVYTTVYPLTYFAERIGGDRVQVESVYPAGSNEHTFEPSQQDMIAIAEADLLFYIGLGLEGFIDSARNTLSGEGVEFVATADAISDEELEAGHLEEAEEEGHEEHGHEEEHAAHEEEAESHEGHDHGSTDPHVWISPVLSQSLAESIKNSLSEADPEGAEMYESNYEELVTELEQLDQSFTEMANGKEQKMFFVSHSAFGYLADAYGLEQIAVAGLNSQSEPSQKELMEIVDLAKEQQIDYIVFEQNVSSNLTEVIRNEVGAEAVQMHNLSVLTQEDIDNGETYFTLMEKNLETLDKILK